MVLLDCGHVIHERCRAHVADEGAKCPVSAACNGSAFMFEDESEHEALLRLRKRYDLELGSAQRTSAPTRVVYEQAKALCRSLTALDDPTWPG